MAHAAAYQRRKTMNFAKSIFTGTGADTRFLTRGKQKMLSPWKLILSLTLFAASAGAGPLAYVTTINYDTFTGEFGTMNPTTGAFNQIGGVISDPLSGLVSGPNGTLLSISFS